MTGANFYVNLCYFIYRFNLFCDKSALNTKDRIVSQQIESRYLGISADTLTSPLSNKTPLKLFG